MQTTQSLHVTLQATTSAVTYTALTQMLFNAINRMIKKMNVRPPRTEKNVTAQEP